MSKYLIDYYYDDTHDAIHRRKRFWKIEEDLVNVPITYAPESEKLIGHIPAEIRNVNTIIEDEKFFTINGKKFRKIAFLKTIFQESTLTKKGIFFENTTGNLFIAMVPQWFYRASDPRYTSWTSCFSPDGCYFRSAIHYATSKNIAIAMILNEDKTKIIGRRWVFIPSGMPLILFAKSYGTFPLHYQRSLSEFIIKNVFDQDKANWSLDSLAENEYGNDNLVSVSCGLMGYSHFKQTVCLQNKQIWFDKFVYEAYPKNIDLSLEKGFVEFIGSDDIEDETNEEESDYCDWCDYAVPEGCLHRVYPGNPHRCDPEYVCETCRDNECVYDSVFSEEYILKDDTVEYRDYSYGTGNRYSIENTYEYNEHLTEVWIAIGLDEKDKDFLVEQYQEFVYGHNQIVEYGDDRYISSDTLSYDEMIEAIARWEAEEEEDDEEVVLEPVNEV